jgi:hypothetical protein
MSSSEQSSPKPPADGEAGGFTFSAAALHSIKAADSTSPTPSPIHVDAPEILETTNIFDPGVDTNSSVDQELVTLGHQLNGCRLYLEHIQRAKITTESEKAIARTGISFVAEAQTSVERIVSLLRAQKDGSEDKKPYENVPIAETRAGRAREAQLGPLLAEEPQPPSSARRNPKLSVELLERIQNVRFGNARPLGSEQQQLSESWRVTTASAVPKADIVKPIPRAMGSSQRCQE